MMLQIELGKDGHGKTSGGDPLSTRFGMHRRGAARIDESEIERYVRFPDTLTEQRVIELSALIDESEEARLVAEFYETFYDRLDRLPNVVTSRLDAFISSIYPVADVVPLFPIRLSVLSDSVFDLVPSSKGNGENARFRPVVLLASRDADTLVCLLRSLERGDRFRVYVLAMDLKRRSNVLVSFTSLNMDAFVPDGSAQLIAPDVDLDVDLLSSAILRYPVMRISGDDVVVSSTDLEPLVGEHPEASVAVRREGADVVVEFNLQREELPNPFRRAVMIAPSEPPRIRSMTSSSDSVRWSDPPEEYTIWLYR